MTDPPARLSEGRTGGAGVSRLRPWRDAGLDRFPLSRGGFLLLPSPGPAPASESGQEVALGQ